MKRNQAFAVGLAVFAAAVLYFRCGSGERAANRTDQAQGAPPLPGKLVLGGGGALKAQRELGSIPLEADIDPHGTLGFSGVVLDDGGTPVAGAEVFLGTAPPRTLTADEDGAFEVSGLPPRSYELEARKDDGVAGPLTVALTAERDKERAGEPIIVTLRLRRVGGLEITVIDASTRRPLAGAALELRGAAVRTATTDGAGRATVRGVAGGSYVLAAVAGGYAVSLRTYQAAERPGAVERITVELRGGVAVSGRVVDSRGVPVGGARVVAEDADALVPLIDADRDAVISDARGAWRIAALAPGSYRFTARSSGHPPGSSAPSRLVANASSDDVLITLPVGARLAGRVATAEGAAAPFATVRVVVDEGSWGQALARQTTCDERGEFAFDGLPRRRLSAVAASGTATSLTRAFDLTAAGDQANVVLALDVSGVIAGVVQDRAGRPIPDAVVLAELAAPMARTRSESTLRGNLSAFADEHGRFELRGLPPGKISLRAAWPGASPRQRTTRLRSPVMALVGARDVVLELERDGGVRGMVQRSDGIRPSMFVVTLGGGAGFGGRDGEFSISSIPPGTHTLRISGPDFATRTLDGIELAAGEYRDLGQITVVAGRKVSGRVLRADGTPVGGVDVVATRQVTGVVVGPAGALVSDLKRTTSADDGKYEFEGLTPLALAVGAEDAREGRSDFLTVPAGSQDQVIDLKLLPVGALRGTVQRGGEPVSGAAVVMAAKGAPSGGSGVTTGTDGIYQFSALPPGTYTLTVMFDHGDGPQLERVQASVTAGETATVDVELPRGSVALVVNARPASPGEPDASGSSPAQALLSRMPSAGAPSGGGSGSSGRSLPLGRTEPARFTELVPGSYELCVLSTANPPDGGTRPPPLCTYVAVAESPSEQQVTVKMPAGS
jgi:Carboxypeptidase regulatory-like domain